MTSMNYWMIKKIHASPRFVRKTKLLDKTQWLIVQEEINFFREDPFGPSLDTHPLQEKFKGMYAFSVLPNLRIVFRFTKPDQSEVLFQDIGTHEIYK